MTLKGKLLIASPRLGDPNFERAVILLLEHNPEGALGVVLNRPSETDVVDPLPTWAALAAHPAVVFVGGPVQVDAVVCLARTDPGAAAPAGWEPVVGPLGVLDLHKEPIEYGDSLDQVRLFAGYAGWDEGQLEGELDEGAWFVVDADPADALSPDPDRLWRFVLRRQGSPLARLANYPPDPSLN